MSIRDIFTSIDDGVNREALPDSHAELEQAIVQFEREDAQRNNLKEVKVEVTNIQDRGDVIVADVTRTAEGSGRVESKDKVYDRAALEACKKKPKMDQKRKRAPAAETKSMVEGLYSFIRGDVDNEKLIDDYKKLGEKSKRPALAAGDLVERSDRSRIYGRITKVISESEVVVHWSDGDKPIKTEELISVLELVRRPEPVSEDREDDISDDVNKIAAIMKYEPSLIVAAIKSLGEESIAGFSGITEDDILDILKSAEDFELEEILGVLNKKSERKVREGDGDAGVQLQCGYCGADMGMFDPMDDNGSTEVKCKKCKKKSYVVNQIASFPEDFSLKQEGGKYILKTRKKPVGRVIGEDREDDISDDVNKMWRASKSDADESKVIGEARKKMSDRDEQSFDREDIDPNDYESVGLDADDIEDGIDLDNPKIARAMKKLLTRLHNEDLKDAGMDAKVVDIKFTGGGRFSDIRYVVTYDRKVDLAELYGPDVFEESKVIERAESYGYSANGKFPLVSQEDIDKRVKEAKDPFDLATIQVLRTNREAYDRASRELGLMNVGKVNEKQYAYDVFLNGKEIDTVFYSTKQPVEDIKRSLVDHDGYDPRIEVKLAESKVNDSDLPLDQSGAFVGWIALYNGKKVEILKSEANDLWDAKQLAAKKLNVPKSKMGLLAIEPAHESKAESEEFTSLGEAESTEQHKAVAQEIAQQLGGTGRLKAMIGAKNFGYDAGSGSGRLVFKFMRSDKGINSVSVSLNAMDTYDIKFMNATGKVIKELEGVYNEDLKRIFTDTTGLALLMPHIHSEGKNRADELKPANPLDPASVLSPEDKKRLSDITSRADSGGDISDEDIKFVEQCAGKMRRHRHMGERKWAYEMDLSFLGPYVTGDKRPGDDDSRELIGKVVSEMKKFMSLNESLPEDAVTELEQLVAEFEAVTTVEDFDYALRELYALGDDYDIWINTNPDQVSSESKSNESKLVSETKIAIYADGEYILTTTRYKTVKDAIAGVSAKGSVDVAGRNLTGKENPVDISGKKLTGEIVKESSNSSRLVEGKYKKYLKQARDYYSKSVPNYIPDAEDIASAAAEFMEEDGLHIDDVVWTEISKEAGVEESILEGARDTIKALAKKAGKSIQKAYRYGKEAMKSYMKSHDKKKDELKGKDWKYIIGVVKKRLGLPTKAAESIVSEITAKQHNQSGVEQYIETLELKPKLEKYLMDKMGIGSALAKQYIRSYELQTAVNDESVRLIYQFLRGAKESKVSEQDKYVIISRGILDKADADRTASGKKGARVIADNEDPKKFMVVVGEALEYEQIYTFKPPEAVVDINSAMRAKGKAIRSANIKAGTITVPEGMGDSFEAFVKTNFPKVKIIGYQLRPRNEAVEYTPVTDDTRFDVTDDIVDSTASELGINFDEVNREEFKKGLEVEQEHADITKGDPVETAKVAIAHLKELPDYYTRLDKMEQAKEAIVIRTAADLRKFLGESTLGDIEDYARDMKRDHPKMSYKELVDAVLDVPQFSKWFDSDKNGIGNEFDLRHWLENKLESKE